MFAKVFTQIFESTIAEDYKVRHIFMDLLVMADSDGVVDKTPESIARIANVPLEEINYGIQALCAPDLKSRTDVEDGRRLVPLEPNRSWGWRIVNYQKYRDIRDEEARRIANRTYKRMQREREKSASSTVMSSNVSNVSTCQPMQREKQKYIKPKYHKGGNTTYSSEKIAPPPKFKQSDFDERDIRKLSEAETDILRKLSAQVGSSDPITEEQFFTAACEQAGLTVQRGLHLKKIQREWPK